jgi:hypothetical protein
MRGYLLATVALAAMSMHQLSFSVEWDQECKKNYGPASKCVLHGKDKPSERSDANGRPCIGAHARSAACAPPRKEPPVDSAKSAGAIPGKDGSSVRLDARGRPCTGIHERSAACAPKKDKPLNPSTGK